MNNLTDVETLTRGHVLLSRTGHGLFLVTYTGDNFIQGHTIDSHGLRPKKAQRRRLVRRERIVPDFQLYRPCRWDLDCLAQAGFGRIEHGSHGVIDSCADHAVEHVLWQAACEGVHVANWPYEPEPDCWCPDGDRGRVEVEYCPAHGTPIERGTNLGTLLTANIATLTAARDEVLS